MAVINFDRTKSTMHIYTMKAHKDLENGNVVGVGGMAVGVANIAEGECFNAIAPAKGKKKVLIGGVPLMADEKKFESDYKIKQGELVRGLELESGDIIGMQLSCMELNGATPEVGQLVVVEAGKEKLAVKATAGADDEVYGEIIEMGTLAFEQALWFLV